jgi:NAD(P)-dependent dehydrogenase (short-subunit alcohol dehydrogenase family)
VITADLTAKAVLITGGGSGIGLAATALFARCGATVAANVLPGDDAAIARIGRLAAGGLSVFAAPGDVASPADAARMVGEAVAASAGSMSSSTMPAPPTRAPRSTSPISAP